MSEQINKVLASTSQAFTTAEQKQARDNIGALAATASGLTGVYTDANLTGSGTSGEPLGLSSTVRFENSTSATKVGPAYVSAANNLGTSWVGPGAVDVSNSVYSQTAYLAGGSLTFRNTATSEKVDLSSIQRWNTRGKVTRWESAISSEPGAYSYSLLNIPESASAVINVRGRFDKCSYINIETSNEGWLSMTGVGTAGGALSGWPLTNIYTPAIPSAASGFTPKLQLVTTGNPTYIVSMEIEEP